MHRMWVLPRISKGGTHLLELDAALARRHVALPQILAQHYPRLCGVLALTLLQPRVADCVSWSLFA